MLNFSERFFDIAGKHGRAEERERDLMALFPRISNARVSDSSHKNQLPSRPPEGVIDRGRGEQVKHSESRETMLQIALSIEHLTSFDFRTAS